MFVPNSTFFFYSQKSFILLIIAQFMLIDGPDITFINQCNKKQSFLYKATLQSKRLITNESSNRTKVLTLNYGTHR